MIDFPIDDLLDQEASLAWLERYLHPEGLKCPRCGGRERRVARQMGAWTAYRCQACDRYHTILTGTVFEKTRQPPSKLVLILRGIAKGEPTARLARELEIDRAQLHGLRQRVQANLAQTRPTAVLAEPVFEADELYQNAGEKRRAPSGSRRSAQETGQ
jgi:transposase-like protein